MSGTYVVTMGDRGRLVVPVELREHAGLVEGRQLVMLETSGGVVLLTREQAKERGLTWSLSCWLSDDSRPLKTTLHERV
jgi:bifunctional DNA-binding transcriptional regulator/antitoxin component of YhaV-PrlF toxin-antitoxin module